MHASLKNLSKQINTGDIWGGLAASAVVLPQAMAFGVALLSPLGIGTAQGALSGLLAAAMLCIASGVSGGTRGLISAPTGPCLILLAGAMIAIHSTGATGSVLLLNLVAIVVLAGIFQFILGLTGGGRLIKYIPYPVISGFMTGSAILMILSQIKPLTSHVDNEAWQMWHWLPLLAAGITYLAMYLAPKYIRWLPNTIAGIIIGTIAFHIITLMNPGPVPEIWLIGELPELNKPGYVLSFEYLNGLIWYTIVPAALALAVLASIDTLLTSVIADVTTGERHKANYELAGQGIGHVLSGLAGGMAGAGTTGATIVSVKSGGRRWSGFMAGIAILVIIFIAGKLVQVLPVSVLAGIILFVGIHMLDLDILAWFKDRRMWQDAGIAVLVIATTVFYDLMAAVGLGVIIAIILFIRSQIKAPVVHRRSTAHSMRSLHRRSAREREILEAHGDRIVLYELRGNLFFATADRLLEELMPDLDAPNYIILHMQRVAQVDLTAIKFLQQIESRLNKNHGALIFCNVHHGIGIGFNIQDVFKTMGREDQDSPVLTFNGKDEALEYAENMLLEELGEETTHISDIIPLSENELCRNLDEDKLYIFEKLLKEKKINRGEKLFFAGDASNELYLVMQGEIEIRLPTTKHHYKRLANYGPGTYFGELGLLKSGMRVADAIATYPGKLLLLSQEAFTTLSQEHPEIAVHLLKNLAETTVEHQRWSTAEIQRLSEW